MLFPDYEKRKLIHKTIRMQTQEIYQPKCGDCKNNIAPKRRQAKCSTREKVKNPFLSIKTPILKSKSDLIFYKNPKQLLKLLYPIGKHYINDDIPNMDIYEFNNYLIKKITKNLDNWNIYQNDKMELELWTGQGNGFDNGFCAELQWIFNLKEEFQTFMWDYFSYLVQKFNIPFLHNIDYMVDISDDYFTENLEDIDDIDEMEEMKQTLKVYRDKVLPLYQKVNFEKSIDTEFTLKDKLSKIKINNYKDQKLVAWIEEGFEIVNVNFNDFVPFKSLKRNNDVDDYLFGPEYYANFLWSIDETDFVFQKYEEQGQYYYNNCEILPFYQEQQLTENNPFLKDYNNDFPEKYKKWLENSYLIYE